MAEHAYDLVLRGGMVFDGAGGPAFQADVGMRDGVIVAVGKGLAAGAEEIAQLFTMFRRAKRAEATREGWGIGLTLVKGIAEALGGTVAVESRQGHGTTFFVELPRDSRPFQAV